MKGNKILDMKRPFYPTNWKKEDPGFALIATISVLVLLALIAVGLLSLSSVSLRTSSGDQALSEARANARMALILAIAELQKATGPDTRITAPADSLAGGTTPEHVSQLTGVWRSWEGLKSFSQMASLQ